MSGVITADVKRARMMQVAVASPISLVALVKPWEPEYPERVQEGQQPGRYWLTATLTPPASWAFHVAQR
eukprot:1580362-Pyramimonas_sp.AAC.1